MVFGPLVVFGLFDFREPIQVGVEWGGGFCEFGVGDVVAFDMFLQDVGEGGVGVIEGVAGNGGEQDQDDFEEVFHDLVKVVRGWKGLVRVFLQCLEAKVLWV